MSNALIIYFVLFLFFRVYFKSLPYKILEFHLTDMAKSDKGSQVGSPSHFANVVCLCNFVLLFLVRESFYCLFLTDIASLRIALLSVKEKPISIANL